MITTISTADARNRFTEIINSVASGNDQVVLTHKGQEVAALVSMRELEMLRQIENHIDIKDAQKALAEPGANIPAQEVWEQLGL